MMHKASSAELLLAGWLPPNAAADRLGITVRQLEKRARENHIRRREVAPRSGIFLYEVPHAG